MRKKSKSERLSDRQLRLFDKFKGSYSSEKSIGYFAINYLREFLHWNITSGTV